jgi:hypothetical protein
MPTELLSDRYKRIDMKAMVIALVVATFIAFVMLMPIGSNTRIATTPTGNVLDPYYWSLGTIFILEPLFGESLKQLDLVTIPIGIALVALAGWVTYRTLRGEH